MDVLGWLLWALAKAVVLVWSLVWFLVGGWVSALAQIAVVLAIVFGYRYGWRQAPVEIARQVTGFARFAWGWMRTGSAIASAAAPRGEVREVVRIVHVKSLGDVNLSSLLSVLMLAGLVGLGLTPP